MSNLDAKHRWFPKAIWNKALLKKKEDFLDNIGGALTWICRCSINVCLHIVCPLPPGTPCSNTCHWFIPCFQCNANSQAFISPLIYAYGKISPYSLNLSKVLIIVKILKFLESHGHKVKGKMAPCSSCVITQVSAILRIPYWFEEALFNPSWKLKSTSERLHAHFFFLFCFAIILFKYNFQPSDWDHVFRQTEKKKRFTARGLESVTWSSSLLLQFCHYVIRRLQLQHSRKRNWPFRRCWSGWMWRVSLFFF